MPVSVAADGNSLTVVVPNEATTGAVRLATDTAGILLQVVPVLGNLTIPNGYSGGGPQTPNPYPTGVLTGPGAGPNIGGAGQVQAPAPQPMLSMGPAPTVSNPNNWPVTNSLVNTRGL